MKREDSNNNDWLKYIWFLKKWRIWKMDCATTKVTMLWEDNFYCSSEHFTTDMEEKNFFVLELRVCHFVSIGGLLITSNLIYNGIMSFFQGKGVVKPRVRPGIFFFGFWIHLFFHRKDNDVFFAYNDLILVFSFSVLSASSATWRRACCSRSSSSSKQSIACFSFRNFKTTSYNIYYYYYHFRKPFLLQSDPLRSLRLMKL